MFHVKPVFLSTSIMTCRIQLNSGSYNYSMHIVYTLYKKK